MRQVVGIDMTREAARQVYEEAGVGPQDIQVVELHDCFAHNELLTYEGLGLCPEGGAQQFVIDGDNTYGGRLSPILPARGVGWHALGYLAHVVAMDEVPRASAGLSYGGKRPAIPS